MVQVSLKRIGCIVGLLTPAILAGVFFVLFTDVGCNGHAANNRSQPNPLDVAELHRFAPPDKVEYLDCAQKDEVRRIYAEIIEAYSNRQVEVLREWRRKLPERVELIGRSDFDDIERPFFRVFFEDVVLKMKRKQDCQFVLNEYKDAGDFERKVATMLLLAGIYGDVRLRRRVLGGVFKELEALVVYRLTSYRDCFRAAGRTDLDKVADRFLAEWIDQIESENGYTRMCLVKSIAFYRVWGDGVMKEHSQTWEEVSQMVVRAATHGLISAGYTPKWLEEFRNIPRHAAPRNVSPKE